MSFGSTVRAGWRAPVRLEKKPEEPPEVVRRAPSGLRDERVDLRLGQVGEEPTLPRRRQHGEVTHVLEEITGEALRIVSVRVELAERRQTGARIAVEDAVCHREHEPPVGGAEYAAHRGIVDRPSAHGQHLLEQRLRIAEAPFRLARDQRDRLLGEGDALRVDRAFQVRAELAEADPPEVVTLAARDHRGQYLVRIGRREHELHVRRWLLERLQERIERMLREHVHFVDDEDLEAARMGRCATVPSGRAVDLRATPRRLSTSKALPSAIRGSSSTP
jgi:hypothetical protein